MSNSLLKKVTSAVALTAIVASTIGSVSSTYASTAELEAAAKLADAGVITTASDYRLGDTITRREMLKVMVNLGGVTVENKCEGKFTDLPASDWGCKYAEAALAKGWIAANAKFRPNDNVSKAEAVKMVMKAKGLEKDSTAGLSWEAAYVKAAVAAKLVDTAFTDYTTASKRGFTIVAASNALSSSSDDLGLGDLLGDLTGGSSTGTTTDTTTDTTNVVKAGDLEVSLNPASSASTSVPNNGTVAFGKFDLTAGSSDVSVSTIKLAREGLGNRSDIYRVWMEKDGRRVTGRQTLGTDNTVIVSFSPAYVVKAGSTESLDLTVSLTGSTTGGQHKFTIASASDVSSSAATVAGNYPLSTATMTTASYTVTPVTFATGGTAGTYKAGDKNVELAQFKLTNNANDDKQVQFKSVTFRQEGDGDFAKNVSNLALYKNGAKISSDVKIDGKDLTFTVSDTIEYGRQETYYVRGDITSVDKTTGDTYKLSLRYSDDINIVETTTQFKAAITTGTTSVMANNTVSGGDIIMSKSTSVNSTQTVAPGSNDVVLFAADLKVASAITLQDLTTSFSTSATGNLSSVFNTLKLVIGNNVVATYTPTTSNTVVFEWTFNVPATTTVKILANVKSNGVTTGAYKIGTIGYSSFARVEYVSNGNLVSSSEFAGSTDGITTTMGAATLTFTENDGISNQNLAVGSTDKTVAQFAMRANDVSDVNVTKLKFTPVSKNSSYASGAAISTADLAAYAAGLCTWDKNVDNTASGAVSCTINPNYSNISSVKLYVDGVLKSTKSMSSGYADFNDINITVAKNSSVTVRVAADFSSAISSQQRFELAIASATNDVTAKDVNSVDVTKSTATNVNGPEYTFVSAGSATLTLNSSTPNSNILVPGDTETELARYTLAASDDDLKLTDLYVKNLGDADLSARIKTVSLYDAAGNKLAGGSVLGTGTVQFSLGNSSSFVVAKNTSNTVVVVKAAFNTITDAAQTNKTVKLAVGSYETTVSGTTNGARFVSASTGNDVTSVTSSAASANTGVLLHTKPTVATSGAATASTHTFTVTADAAGKLTLTGVTVSLNTYNSATGTFTLYKDQEVAGNEIGTGTVNGTGGVIFSYFTNTEISAGTTKTFVFKVSSELQSANANAKRIFRVTDISFVDNTDTGTQPTINSIRAYSNVGLPTAESTFTY